MTRRTVIKGVGVTAAAAWAVPVLTSATASAAPGSVPGVVDLAAAIVVTSGPTQDPTNPYFDYTFDLNITNNGPDTATGVQYLLTSIYDNANGGTVENDYTSSNLPFTFNDQGGNPNHTTNYLTGPLASGVTWTIAGAASISSGDTLQMTITQLKAGEVDSNPANNTASVTLTP